jgi:hypothetical protein
MTAPPLPSIPCLRVRLDYTQQDTYKAGSRFYLSYGGAAPTAGNCATLASDIATAWSANIASQIVETFALTEVDVLDIASLTGASGQWTGSEAGTLTGGFLPSQVATNVEFDIARRYRGGKPRMYFPPPDASKTLDAGHYSAAFVTAMNTQVADFFTAIEALSIGAVGALAHVNVSYYKGFTNITNSSGRERAVPTYRDTALVEAVNGYSTKGTMGSQRRRRIAVVY